MISMRAWPNAPRGCLLESTLCSEVTCVASSVMFFWASSITASRSLQLLQAVDGLLREVVHRLTEPVRHRIEPLVDHAAEVRLAPGQQVAHRLDAGRRLRLQARQLGELAFAVVARAQRPRHDHGQCGERREPGHDDGGHAGQSPMTIRRPCALSSAIRAGVGTKSERN